MPIAVPTVRAGGRDDVSVYTPYATGCYKVVASLDSSLDNAGRRPHHCRYYEANAPKRPADRDLLKEKYGEVPGSTVQRIPPLSAEITEYLSCRRARADLRDTTSTRPAEYRPARGVSITIRSHSSR